MIGQAVYAKLINDTNITALVDNRVYPELAPDVDGTVYNYPLIAYSCSAGSRDHSQDGPCNPMEWSAKLVLVSKDYPTADLLADAVRTSIDGDRSVWGTITVKGAFHEPERDNAYEVGDARSSQRFFVREMEFSIWINE